MLIGLTVPLVQLDGPGRRDAHATRTAPPATRNASAIIAATAAQTASAPPLDRGRTFRGVHQRAGGIGQAGRDLGAADVQAEGEHRGSVPVGVVGLARVAGMLVAR